MNRTAQVISYIFHPVLMPLIGILVIFNSGLYYSELPQQAKNLILILTGLSTIILPVTVLPALIYLRHIESFTLDERRERLIPLFFTTICFYMAHHLMHKFLSPMSPNIFSTFLLADTFVVLFLLAISLFWKVSIHTAGIGGITGLIAFISLQFTMDLTFFMIIAILLSGLVFSARLALKAHTIGQLIAGYLVGFLPVFILLLLTIM